jgi:hypothetical protein
MPVINDVECGCAIDSNDGQKTFVNWTKCQTHIDLSFTQLKKICIDENLLKMSEQGDMNEDQLLEIKNSFYSAHGIEDDG